MGNLICPPEQDFELLVNSICNSVKLTDTTFFELVDSLDNSRFDTSLIEDFNCIRNNDNAPSTDMSRIEAATETIALTKESFMDLCTPEDCSTPYFENTVCMFEFLYKTMSTDPSFSKTLLLLLPYLKDDGKKHRIYYILFSKLTKKQNTLRELSSLMITHLMIHIRGISIKLKSTLKEQDQVYLTYIEKRLKTFSLNNIREFHWRILDPFLKTHYENPRNVDMGREITFQEFESIFEQHYYFFNFQELRRKFISTAEENENYE